MSKQSYVYFIKPVGMEGPIKIGCSEYPAYRVKTLMAWSPFDLEVIASVDGGLDLERSLHDVFAIDHRRGEWFNPSPMLLSVIAKLKSGVPVAEAVDLEKRSGNIRSKRKRNISADTKLRLHYAQTINGRLRAHNNRAGTDLVTPKDIDRIFDKWRGHWKDPAGTSVRPTEAEFARLDAFILGLPFTAVRSQYWRELAAARARAAA